MKNFNVFLWCLISAMAAAAIIVPDSRIYPTPLPTTGSTPLGAVRVSAPIAPNNYNSTFPSAVTDFIGGGPKMVQSIADRDAINTAFLQEGTICWVKDDGHMYQLIGGLTTWVDLGLTTTWGTGGGAVWVASVADMRNLAAPTLNGVVTLEHHTDQDAPQGGTFLWHPGVVNVDDGVDNVICTASPMAGTWIRQ